MAFQDDDIKPPRPLPFDYDRQTRFNDYQKNNPAGPDVRGVDLDAEFDDVERALDETQSRLRIIQRDDGRVRNGVITRETLDPSIAIGFSPPEDWEPETFYTLTSSVFFDSALYLSRVDHVSDPLSFQTDLDAGRWELAIDFRSLTTDAEAARDLARQWANELEDVEVLPGEFSANHFRLKAASSATTAQTAETGALDSAAAASASESAAASSEAAAAASETNASASETAAASSETNASISETNAAASLTDFRSRYYGELAGDPATDPNGDPINAGDLYWNTTANDFRVFNGTAWESTDTQIAGHATETGGVHGIPAGERAMHSADQLSHRNKIINGGFDIWQRGTTSTSDGYSTTDRWVSSQSGGAMTVSRQEFTPGQTDVPGEPKYFFRHDRTTAAPDTGTLLYQRMEGVRTLAGQTATVSFWARVDVGKEFIVRIAQLFGSGGSANNVLDIGVFSGTGEWTKYTFTEEVPSIAGKTIGSEGEDVLQLAFVESGTTSTFTLDIAQVQTEAGSIATPFEKRSVGEELALCQRYYFSLGGGATMEASSFRDNGSSLERRVCFTFPAKMRAVPSVQDLTTTGSNPSVRQISDFAATLEADAATSGGGAALGANFDAEL